MFGWLMELMKNSVVNKPINKITLRKKRYVFKRYRTDQF